MTLPTITATGNVAADPELRYTQSGKAATTVRILCNESRKKPEGGYETVSTTGLDAQFWETDAQQVADHIRKGDYVTVTGQLTVRHYDKQDGSKGTAVEVKYPRISKGLPKAGATTAAAPGQVTIQPNAWSTAPATNQPADPWATEPAPF